MTLSKNIEKTIEIAEKPLKKGIMVNMVRDAVSKAVTDVVATGRVRKVIYVGELTMGNPKLVLMLDVSRPGIETFQHQLITTVSSSQTPKIGDTVQLADNPYEPGEYLYLGIDA